MSSCASLKEEYAAYQSLSPEEKARAQKEAQEWLRCVPEERAWGAVTYGKDE